MARQGRKDRGLYSKRDTAEKVLWYVRLYHEGRDRRFGSFPNKTKAREFYEKAKLEQAEGRFFPERYQKGGYAKLADVIDNHLATFTKTRFLSMEEEEALCDKLGPRYAAWVRLAILTGMRQQEQFSFRWENVDMQRGVWTLPTTKAGGVQYVRLNEEAKTLLQSLIPGNKSVWVFPSENPETHADARNFYRRYYLPAVKELGLTEVTWHTLRHTFASRLAMGGVTEGTIASLLRHSGTALVRRYAHLSPSYLQEAVEKVSSFGKVAKEPAKKPAKQEPESGEEQAGRAEETVSAISTGPGTGKSREAGESQ
jgi:integrase